MGATRRWSDEDKTTALDMLRDGVGTREVSRRTGVSSSCLSRWAKAAGIVVDRAAQTTEATEATKLKWAQRRDLLVDRFGEVAQQLLDRAVADDTDPGDTRHLIWSAAVSVDKAQVLSGGVTSRHEILDAQRRRSRVEEIADELAARREVREAAGG